MEANGTVANSDVNNAVMKSTKIEGVYNTYTLVVVSSGYKVNETNIVDNNNIKGYLKYDDDDDDDIGYHICYYSYIYHTSIESRDHIDLT